MEICQKTSAEAGQAKNWLGKEKGANRKRTEQELPGLSGLISQVFKRLPKCIYVGDINGFVERLFM